MTRRSTTWKLGLAGLLVAALAACRTVACNASPQGTSAPDCSLCPSGAPVVDTRLMAFLSLARSLHHEADLKEQQGDLAGAIAALDRLVATPSPAGAVEADEVTADAYARMAELRTRAGDLDGAARDVARGLSHAKEPTYFRGHLLEVEGLVLESRAGQLADAGRADEAARAKSDAIRRLEEAVSVQEQVIKTSLGEDGGGSP
jgi:tetratricopeptide (TPR) repeat protein